MPASGWPSFPFRSACILCVAFVAFAAFAAVSAPPVLAQEADRIRPVTDAELQDPSPDEWLMWRRTLNGWGPMRHATAAAAQDRRPRPRHRAPHLGGAVRADARRRSVHHGRSAFALNARSDLTIGQAAAYVRDCRGARGPFGRGVLTRPILAPRARRRRRPNHRWRLSWPSRTPDAPPPARLGRL